MGDGTGTAATDRESERGRDEEGAIRRRIERYPVEGSVDDKRRAFAALADLPLDATGVRLERGLRSGLETLSVTPDPADEGAAPRERAPLVHFHGGGYVFGSPATHARLAVQLARSAGRTVHVPAYPLAPESVWPAQRERTIAWLEGLGAGAGVVLSGDSAGGHLALSVALALPAVSRAALAGLVLFSPNTLRDYARSASRRHNASRDAMNDPEQDDALAALAFGETRADDPEQNPLDVDLSTLPPLYVDVGADEVLLDDALLLARRAALDGIAVDLHVAAGRFHLRQLFAQHWLAADESLARAGAWIRARD